MHTSDNTEKLLTINQLSQRLSVPKPTLRFWEEKLGKLIIPLRTNGGQRRYTAEHVSIIQSIKEFREMGKSIPEIKEILENGHQENPEFNNADIQSLSDRISRIVMKEISDYLNKKAI